MTLPSLPFSRIRLPFLAFFGLFAVLCGCTRAENDQKSDTPSNSATQTAPSSVVMQPHHGDHLRIFAETKDTLGTGEDIQIYVNPGKFPQALASFAKFGLGIGVALPVYRHDRTEEVTHEGDGNG